MRLACVKHPLPAYDPDWLSGAPLFTIPVFGTLSLTIAFCLLQENAQWSAGSLAAAMAPLAAGLVLGIVRDIRIRRARRGPEACTLLADRVLGGMPGHQRLACEGDQIELTRLLDEIARASPHRATTPYVRPLFLHSMCFLLLCGWVAHVWFGAPRGYLPIVLAVVLAVAVVWRLCCATRYEISPGRLRVIPSSPVPGRTDSAFEIDLDTARLACRYQDGVVVVMESGGETFTIPLNGMSSRHDFVHSLFRAAMAPRDTGDRAVAKAQPPRG